MLTLDSGACNTIPFSALGDPRAVREGSKRYVRLPSGKVARVISLNGVWVAEMGMLEYTTQSLPPVTGLPEGTEVFVGNYNGNIARLINGVWRYISPFIVAWASRPAANAVPIGTELQVTDYGNQKWISDGTYWRPAQGRAIIKGVFGLVAAGGQIAQLSGVSSGVFAIPGGSVKIPTGMILPHSRLYTQADGFKSGTNGTANWRVFLGTTNSVSDSQITTFNLSNTNGINAVGSGAARFGTATDRFNSRNWQGEGITAGSNTSMIDRLGNVNTNADMWLNVGVTDANVLDTFNLITLQVVLEA